MGRNRIAELLTIAMLCVAGCAKPSFEASRQNLIRNQAKKSPRATLANQERPQILPATHFAAGRMFEAQGHYAQAIEQYAKTIAVSHDHVAAYHRLGLIYSKLEKHDESIEVLRKAIEIKPDNAVLHNNLGFELMFVKDWDGATKHLAEAIALEPTFARAHINLGMTLSKIGRFDEALAHFRAVLPEPDAEYNLGLMYRSAQRYDDAARSFRRVLTADPNFQAAQTQLADIAPHLTPVADPNVGATTEAPTLADNRRDSHDEMERRVDRPVVVAPSIAWNVREEPMTIPPSSTDAIASTAGPFDLFLLQHPGDDEALLGNEPAGRSLVATENAAVPVPANEAVADAQGAVPFGRLNDEVARIDDEVRCLIDEALETMALATPQVSVGDAVQVGPVLIEPMSESIIGNFVADSTEPIKYPAFVEPSVEVIEAPIEQAATPANRPVSEQNSASRMHWRTRLNSLSANLAALRDEINCLEAADVNATGAQEHITKSVVATKVEAKPKAEKVAPTTPRRPASRKRSRTEDPNMMLAYRPTADSSILDAQRSRPTASHSSSTVRENHEDPPVALARPAEMSDIYSAVEIGPALPARQSGRTHARTERSESDWDAQFGDLSDLLSITENEIRCWAEIEEEQEAERVTDNATAEPQRRKTRVTPVRYRPRRNPFYNK